MKYTLFSLFLVLLVAQLSDSVIQVDNNSYFFKDTFGRSLLFHGVNSVYKTEPWYPNPNEWTLEGSLSLADAKNISKWGFNVVRLGVMWPGVSPSSSFYNETYLSEIENIVNTLGSQGIYTLLDCHQDVFSRYFCGEGVPDWAVPQKSLLDFPKPISKSIGRDSNGYPNLTQCLDHEFAEYYLTDAVSKAFQDFYDNKHGLIDDFSGFWKRVASKFVNNENVLGYELINEPWAGNIYLHPEYLVVQGKADKENLVPLYNTLSDAIRSIDDEHIIFFEPTVSDILQSGFTEPPGGNQYSNRTAYSYHIYCAPTDSNGDPTKLKICELIDDFFFDEKMKDHKRIKSGSMMTEFGAMQGTTTAIEDINFLLNKADENIQSWSYWQYKFNADLTTASQTGAESFYLFDGTLDQPKVRALSRTYAQAVSGTPTTHQFDPITARFDLTYDISTTATNRTTVIYYNQEYYYPDGISVTVTPNNIVNVEQTDRYILVTHNAGSTGSIDVSIKSG